MSNTNTPLATWYNDLVVQTEVKDDGEGLHDVVQITVWPEAPEDPDFASGEITMSTDQARELIAALQVAIAEVEG